MGNRFTRGLGAALAVLVAGCAQGGGTRAQAPEEPRSSSPASAEDAGEDHEAARGAPGVGERAPDVTVVGADGERVALASSWAESPLVLIFYRGHW